MTLTSIPDKSSEGQEVEFIATVTSAPEGKRIPTGSVKFKSNGGGRLESKRIDESGKASFRIAGLKAGTTTISAVYSGDGEFLGGEVTMNHEVLPKVIHRQPLPQPGKTSLVLICVPNPSRAGQDVNLTAKVTAIANLGRKPTGIVTFGTPQGTLGTRPLDDAGLARLTINNISVGLNEIVAEYGGDGNYLPSNDRRPLQVFNLASTTTKLISSVDSSCLGEPITLTVTVRGDERTRLTGTVTFFAVHGKTEVPLGTKQLNEDGQAELIRSLPKAGSNRLRAQYSGDANFLSSESNEITHSVRDPAAEAELKKAQDLIEKRAFADARLELKKVLREHPGTIEAKKAVEAKKAEEMIDKLPPLPGIGGISQDKGRPQ
jgi:hypothetical protein